MKSLLTVCFLLVVLAMHGSAQSEAGGQEVYEMGYSALLEEKWTIAKQAFQEITTSYPSSRWVEGARYWLCYVGEQTGEAPESVFLCNQEFVASYPKSRWVSDARSNMIRIGRQLARQGDPKYEPIIKVMQDSLNEDIKLAALYSMEDIKSQETFNTVVDLYNQNPSERIRAKIAYMLGMFRTRKAGRKLAEIAEKDTSDQVRLDAVRAMANIGGNEVNEELMQLSANARSADVRRAAVEGMMRSTIEIPALRSVALNDLEEETARQATRKLGTIEGSASGAALLEILAQSKGSEVRRCAIQELAVRGDTAAVSVFRRLALDDADRAIRKSAVEGLAHMRSVESTGSVLVDICTSSHDPDVQEVAILALGTGGYNDAQHFLLATALNSPNPRTAKAAVISFGNLMMMDAISPLTTVALKARTLDARKRALEFVNGAQGGLSVSQLSMIVEKEKDPDMRRLATIGLGLSGMDSAVSILAGLASNDADHDVRSQAVAGLRKIGSPKAKEALLKIVQGF